MSSIIQEIKNAQHTRLVKKLIELLTLKIEMELFQNSESTADTSRFVKQFEAIKAM